MGSLVAELAEKLSSATNNFDIDEGTIYVNTSADTVGIGTTSPGSKFDVQGTMQVGVNDTGHDVKFFGATAGAYLEWDESADELELRGGAATPGKLLLSTAETTVVDGNEIGRINFQAPLDSAGTDAILVGASIYAEADATFSASVNATELVFATGASEAAAEKMRITSDGNVGIGTTAPSSALHISAADVASSGTSNAQLHIRDTAAFSAAQNAGIAFEAEWQNGSFTQIAAINASRDSTSTGQYGGHLKFNIRTHGANVSEAMRILSDGKVGIGTTAPTNVLHIAQADTSSTYISFTNSTTGHAGTDGFFIGVNGGGTAPVNLWNLENTAMRFATNDTQRMTILGNGKVGIGTSAPNTHLEVSDGVPTFRLNSTEGNVGDTDILGEISWKSADANRTGDPIAYIRALSENATGSATGLAFGTGFDSNNASERMRIKNSGNVGIGTTNPATALTVSGAFGGDTNFLSIISTGTVLHRNLYFTNTHLYFYNGTNNPYLSGTGAWTDASDENIKKNIEDIDYGLETINTLKPRKFKHKADDVEDIGFIAQEVELIVPEVVAGGPDESAGKGLAYGRLTSILTKAVQELSAKNDALEAKVKALEDA